MEDKDSEFHVVEAIVALSKKLRHFESVAEGIETIQQLKGLQEQLGCKYGQAIFVFSPSPRRRL